MVCIMRSPSTGDADHLDSATNRCVGIAKHLGFGSLSIVNLFASTEMDTAIDKGINADFVGPQNREYFQNILSEDSTIVLAWGNNIPNVLGRNEMMHWLKVKDFPYFSFGLTAKHQPKNPLYLALADVALYSTKIQEVGTSYQCLIQTK